MWNTFLTEVSFNWVARTILRPGKVSPVNNRHRKRTAPASSSEPPQEWPSDAVTFATKSLNFPIDARQTEILAGTPEQSRRVIVCCSRQWGKSTTGAIKAIHHALDKPGSLTLIASRTLPQAAGLLDKIIQFAQSAEIPTRRVPGHPASLLLPNGSRIIAIPGRPKSVRGYSAVSLLIIDEAAYVPDSLYEALRPMLATTNGAIWLLSTPNGQKGFFYREWTDRAKTWRNISVPATECSRISPEFLAEERRKHGQAVFDREYLCKFTSSADTYFDTGSMEVSAAVVPESPTAPVAPAHATVSGESYLTTRFYVGFDLGQKSSHSAIVILERANVTTQDRDPVTWAWIKRTEIHLRRAERLPLDLSYRAIADRLASAIKLLPTTKDVTLVLDATGCGAPFVENLREHHLAALRMPVTITASGPPSISGSTHRISKTDLMSSLNYLITSPDFKVNAPAQQHQAIMSELQNIRMLNSVSGVTRFTSSEQDDLVMAFALAAWPARKCLVPR